MRLCIIIPALNEEQSIGDVIRRIQAVALPPEITERTVVVVDDGSRDRTAEISAGLGAVVARHAVNRGVGKAFQTGIERALALGADLIVNIDADGQFNPDDIPALIAPVVGGRAGFATASRFKDPALVPVMPAVKRWGNAQMSRLVSFISGKTFYDVSCGFRAYSRETALRLNLWGTFTYTQETFLFLCAREITIEEVPIRVRGVREIGESRVASNLWVYARKTSSIIFHAYRDFWPMRFFSILGTVGGIPGLAFLAFLFGHWFCTGSFSPHIWTGFVGGSLIFFSLFCFLTGLLGGMLKRIRLNQEEILYFLKSAHYERLGSGQKTQGPPVGAV